MKPSTVVRSIGAGALIVLTIGTVPAWGHAEFEEGVLPPESDQSLSLNVVVEEDGAVNDRVTVTIPNGWRCRSRTGSRCGPAA